MKGNLQLPRNLEINQSCHALTKKSRTNDPNYQKISACFALVTLTLSDSPQVGKIRKTAARKREYHILFMVLTTAACYLLCWMPYGVVAMMATFGPPNIISPVASVVPSLLAKSSTVINPLIYILMNKQVSQQQFDMYNSFIYIVKKDKLQQLKSYKWSI